MQFFKQLPFIYFWIDIIKKYTICFKINWEYCILNFLNSCWHFKIQAPLKVVPFFGPTNMAFLLILVNEVDQCCQTRSLVCNQSNHVPREDWLEGLCKYSLGQVIICAYLTSAIRFPGLEPGCSFMLPCLLYIFSMLHAGRGTNE